MNDVVDDFDRFAPIWIQTRIAVGWNQVGKIWHKVGGNLLVPSRTGIRTLIGVDAHVDDTVVKTVTSGVVVEYELVDHFSLHADVATASAKDIGRAEEPVSAKAKGVALFSYK